MSGLASLDLDQEIQRLKRERRAVLLAHYYQESELQELADVVGDSLQLAKAAQQTDAEVILFAGVHFMAETAKILNPDRIVLVPDLAAGCSLADGCPVEAFVAWKNMHPGVPVVSYINCSAAVKAESDVICTSSNARKIVESFPRDQPLLFAPDRNLGSYLMRETGRDLVLWPGVCVVHESFSERKLLLLKQQRPDAKIVAHPECEPAVLALADFIGSTAALLAFVGRDTAPAFIVATEPGILHQMKKLAPTKELLPAPPSESCGCTECPFMRLNTPEKVYLALRDLEPRLTLDESLRLRAKVALDRMLELS